MEEGFQLKKKRAMSIESKESILGVGPIADARHAGHEKEFFRINSGADPTGRLVDVADRCRQLPFHLHLPVQWLNECLSKADWKELKQRG